MNLLACLLFFLALASTVCGLACGPFQDNTAQVFLFGQTIFRNPAQYSTPSSFTYQGLTFSLASDATIKVTESNGNVVFTAGSSQGTACSASNRCRVSVQGDGNVVIFNGAGGTWGSNSCGTWEGPGCYGPASYIKFLTTQPYIQILDNNCNIIWPGNAGQPSVNKPRTTTAQGAINTATTAFPLKTAVPAPKWKYQFGVNSHISQGWSSSMVKTMTNYLGVGCIRDSIPSQAPGSAQYQDYQAMNSNGVKLNVVAGGTSAIAGLQSQVNAWATFQQATNMIQSVEGFNEVNNFGFNYNGIDHTQSYAGMIQAQKDLYSLVTSNTNLKNLPVYDMTAACFAPDSASQAQCNNIASRATYTNVHLYPSNGEPLVSVGGFDNYLLTSLDGYSTGLPSGNVITETGYHTDSYANGISEVAASKLHVNLLLNAIVAGNSKSFIYELWDEQWSGYSGPESHFGLFHNDQTPKPSAKALHFLSSLLVDTGSGSTGSLQYSLTNYPYTIQSVLFQNTAKTFFLVLWNNLPVWNPNTNTDISNAATTVTLTLSGSHAIKVYDIYSTQSDTVPLTPISSITGSTVSFGLSDKAVVISIV